MVRVVCRGKPITSKSAEEQYDALEKYGNDLVKMAEQGKLDPVIGRDDEIRRVVQVLSRRTKNNPVLMYTLLTCFITRLLLLNTICTDVVVILVLARQLLWKV